MDFYTLERSTWKNWRLSRERQLGEKKKKSWGFSEELWLLNLEGKISLRGFYINELKLLKKEKVWSAVF